MIMDVLRMLILLGSSVTLQVTANRHCPVRNLALLEKDRNCRKECTTQEECNKSPNKGCYCDGHCGMSCFNKKKGCGEPEAIQNGTVNRNHILWGGEAYYSCNDGFMLVGSESRICNADKKWGGSPPTCQRGCNRPDDIDDSFPADGLSAFAFGQSYDFSCRLGYYMTGNPSRTCISQEEGWTNGQYSCNIQHCDEIADVANGHIIKTNGIRFGSTATLQCDEGYIIDSNGQSMRCFPGDSGSMFGDWRGSLSTCSIITCEKPVAPEHGSIIDAEYIVPEYGNSITYECDTGFKVKGPESGTCNKNREWGDRPTCIENPDCDFSESSSPTCGYSAVGWSRVLGQEHIGFQGHMAKSDTRESYLISMRLPVGWTQEFVCLNFYYKLPESRSKESGILVIEGAFNGEKYWESHENERMDEWKDAAVNIAIGDELQYQFNAIRQSVYLDDIKALPEKCTDHCLNKVCQHGGTCVNRISSHTCFCTVDFTGNQCEIDRKCKEPEDSIPNGSLSYTSNSLLTPDSTATYSCREFHKFSGEYRIIRKKTVNCVWSRQRQRSSWSPDPWTLRCEAITCRSPTVRENSRLINRQDRWLVRSTAQYSCNSGFENRDPQTLRRLPTYITCGYNGEWSGSAPYCIKPFCTFEETRLGGPSVINPTERYDVGKSIRLRCEKGFEIIGDATMVCNSMNTWDREAPACQKISCGDVPALPNYRLRSNRVCLFDEYFEYNDYDCENGYYLQGLRRVTCRFDGTYSRLPVCKRQQQCTDTFPTIVHGWKRVTEYRADFGCDQNYVLAGKPAIHCQKDGTWTHPAPFCKELPPHERLIFNNVEYLVFLDRLNYNEAQTHCRSLHASLATECSGHFTGELDEKLKRFRMNDLKLLTGKRYSTECVVRRRKNFLHWTYFECKRVSCDESNYFLCQRDYDPCNPNPCVNGGTCSRSGTDFKCDCAGGFRGSQCREEIVCFQPRLYNNVHVLHQPQRLRIGSEITLMCMEGYHLEGEETIVCQAGGHWSSHGPRCRAINCPGPNLADHVIVLTSNPQYYLPAQEVTLDCEGGFKFVGYSIITCGFNGEWSRITASCEVVRCRPPTLPNNVVMINEEKLNYTIGDGVDLGCEAGYLSRRTMHITCQEDGSWLDLSRIYCERAQSLVQTTTTSGRTTTTVSTTLQTSRHAAVQCTSPELPNSAYIVEDIEVFTSGSVITLGCLDNRSIKGNPNWQCQGGKWHKTDASCVVAFCVIDPILLTPGIQVEGVSRGALGGRRFGILEKISLTCFGSAVPVHWENADTKSTIVCQEGGRWLPYFGDFDCRQTQT